MKNESKLRPTASRPRNTCADPTVALDPFRSVEVARSVPGQAHRHQIGRTTEAVKRAEVSRSNCLPLIAYSSHRYHRARFWRPSRVLCHASLYHSVIQDVGLAVWVQTSEKRSRAGIMATGLRGSSLKYLCGLRFMPRVQCGPSWRHM